MLSNPTTYSYESLSSDFTKILETESFSDVVLKCGGQSFPAHKAILSGRSSVFASMFQHDAAESLDGVFNITDIDATIFADFLYYLYSGKLPALREDTMPLLYTAGHKYAVEALKKALAAYMMESLKSDNACDFLLLADSHGDEEFKASVISFIRKEEFCILDEDGWLKFQRDHSTLFQELL